MPSSGGRVTSSLRASNEARIARSPFDTFSPCVAAQDLDEIDLNQGVHSRQRWMSARLVEMANFAQSTNG